MFGEPVAFPGAEDLIAWSRLLDDEEALCVVNPHGGQARAAFVSVRDLPASEVLVVVNRP